MCGIVRSACCIGATPHKGKLADIQEDIIPLVRCAVKNEASVPSKIQAVAAYQTIGLCSDCLSRKATLSSKDRQTFLERQSELQRLTVRYLSGTRE